MGLGSCFMWFALDSMRRIPELDFTGLLELPENYEPLLGLAVGHIDEPLKTREVKAMRMGITWK